MGERKVLNKYYPPDFDPAKIPRGSRTKTNEMKVRMMLPMSVRCKTCGNFMYKGTKFNTRKEDVLGEDYLGIQIIRFYYRCTACAAEFTMKTDPKTSDYQLEQGATRNYEPWRASDVEKATAAVERQEEEEGNVMKALENRTLERKRELDIMANLDELRSLNARHGTVTTEQALEALLSQAKEEEEEDEQQAPLPEEDEVALRAFIQQQKSHLVRRIDDLDEDDGPSTSKPAAATSSRPAALTGLDGLHSQAAGEGINAAAKADGNAKPNRGLLPVKVVAKRKLANAEENGSSKKAKQESPSSSDKEGSPPGGGLLGLQSYTSSEEDS